MKRLMFIPALLILAASTGACSHSHVGGAVVLEDNYHARPLYGYDKRNFEADRMRTHDRAAWLNERDARRHDADIQRDRELAHDR